MKEIKSIHEIRNGWLVVVRKGEKYIKIDDVLVGNCDGYLDVEDYGSGLKIDAYSKQLEDFDIVEIWKPKYKAASLSFDLDDRKIVWKEQEQKYYIKHKWLEYKGYEYAGVITRDFIFKLGSEVEDEKRKTQFTLEEIERIKNVYDTTLEDFEIIPVEEI